MTATIASPTADLEAATAKLWVRLREQAAGRALAGLRDGNGLDGLVVTGPQESTDPYGRVWFWFRGTVQVTGAPGARTGVAAHPARERAGLRLGGGSAVIGESAWPLRPVPCPLGNRWDCSLTTAAAATRARRDLRARLGQWSLAGDCTEDAAEDLLLAFEELTSNAFRHGVGGVDVTVAATAGGWLLVVDDEAPDRPPVPAVGRDRALGGMGLGMVAGLSRDVGWQPGPGRKSVWAELPAHR